MTDPDKKELRFGWTTGACATAATKAALTALFGDEFPDPVTITLPKGQKPAFALATEEKGSNYASVSIIKDAGDDPDVTHLARIMVTVKKLNKGAGIVFKAGEGVGTVTREGLPITVGEPAINPVPRQMMREVVLETALAARQPADIEIEVAIENGIELALSTMNGRLGIVGGLSVLGTTGIVVPYSCASWIASLHRGIDVARAAQEHHLAASTGSTSEKAVAELYNLPEVALLDMGDFAGGVLKYIRKHPVPRLTIAGGFAKITKLAQGHMDLHSGRSHVDFEWLSDQMATLKASAELAHKVRTANTAMQVLEWARQANLPLADHVAEKAKSTAFEIGGGSTAIEVIIFDRKGQLAGRSND
ncbi:cobalt-precorrin-5B (C(1))-methyltransferase [Sneathiella marina]|uniref:Cobalt-precorrin-5B C(1)-methyltransferase n=1 Tax=Sneathiella marina TaxID=2950108 RepID=A0ABY4W528_9PROT|nr:cobalt-precorrin-5B (C(1))-methyltransferase [Sneathiella marina]USG62295.1 cobalt-precorrin-5B (C(1))-methyltransferase [Sneathiella marina]